jgi:hypothetical protein
VNIGPKFLSKVDLHLADSSTPSPQAKNQSEFRKHLPVKPAIHKRNSSAPSPQVAIHPEIRQHLPPTRLGNVANDSRGVPNRETRPLSVPSPVSPPLSAS